MALLALAALSCGGGGQQTPTPPSTLGLKPTLHGLIDRNGPPPPEWLGQMGGFVVNAFWSDLQPAENDPIAANNAIDSAIARAQGLEASGAHIGIKVRFYAGIDAPQWAKNLGGGPVTIYDPTAGRGGTVGRFWTPQFGAAYDAVWQQLATKYDSVPEIRQIEVDRCGTVFTESLVRDTAD